MNDVAVRVLDEDEWRTAHSLFRAGLHSPAPTDEEWERVSGVVQPGRMLGAFDTELIGTARSMDERLVIPGGALVSMAGVTGVAVRADRTRRGVLSALMRYQLDDFAARGVVLAMLFATEGSIYGRFGYGIGSRAQSSTVDRRMARFRPEVPVGGAIELLDLDAAETRLPRIYADLPLRPVMMSRGPHWWPGMFARFRREKDPVITAVHHGPEGPDGFVVYQVFREPGKAGELRVADLQYAGPEAFAGLWRFLLGVDLVDTVSVSHRALDEHPELLFTDPRVCRTVELDDESWLRLVDVEAALRAREWNGGGSLVLEVRDPMLAGNNGRFEVGPDGARRTEGPADVRLDVDALAMMFSGAWLPSALVGAGRVITSGAHAVDIADELFHTRRPPWCGTLF